jgi:hypothetical protein
VEAEADEEACISGQGQGEGRERGGMHDDERPRPSGDEELLDACPPKRIGKALRQPVWIRSTGVYGPRKLQKEEQCCRAMRSARGTKALEEDKEARSGWKGGG